MAFRLTITDDAEVQLKALSARDERIIEAAVLARLRDQPLKPSRAIKRLRTNPVVEFELRVGDFRVLYDVVADEVIVLIVGRKVGNTLLVSGEELHEHQSDPPEQPGGGPAGNAG